MWTTNAFLREAFSVIDAWGFKFKSCFVWIKDDIGMGNYWRVSHEFLLLGVRGRLRYRDCTEPSWKLCRRTVHSRKPEAVRLLIEKVSPGPYLDFTAVTTSPTPRGQSTVIRWRSGCSDAPATTKLPHLF